MSDFKTLKGLYIKHISSDPPSPIEGQIWYNTTSKTLKVSPSLTAWASGGNLNTGRLNAGCTSSGPRDASLVFGGEASPNTQVVNESYDGSSWTELGDINTGRRNIAGFGTQTAAVAAGGLIPPATPQTQDLVEEWDGSSWTEVTDVPVAGIPDASSAGTLTAGLLFGGETAGGDGHAAETYHYDGTNWTDGGDLNTARSVAGGAGTQTAALMFGGYEPGDSNNTEEYNGTAWTNGNDLNNTNRDMGSGGIQTNAICAGGGSFPAKNNTELYDGTSWAAGPTLATARIGGSTTSASGNTSAIYFGGLTSPGTPNFTGATEEFTAAVTTRSVDTST